MKSYGITIALAAMLVRSIFLLTGCSSSGADYGVGDFDSEAASGFSEMADFASDNLTALNLKADWETNADIPYESDEPHVWDVIQTGDSVYAVIDDGVLVIALRGNTQEIIESDASLGTITRFCGSIIVGGDGVYRLEGDTLQELPFNEELCGYVTVLHPLNGNLLIGTSEALYDYDGEQVTELAGDIAVTALAADPGGVWVGTSGDGLYHWDGTTFTKRHLQRDATLFDYVTALQYARKHLYVGTDRGFFVFDGGRWRQFGLSDGLPSDFITTINAEEWVIKIGTACGAMTFLNGTLREMPQFEEIIVNRFAGTGTEFVAATVNVGLVMKSGGLTAILYRDDWESHQAAVESGW
jgi:hypothetical protein